MRQAPLPKRVIQRGARFYYRRRSRRGEVYVRLPDLFDPSFPDAVEEAERATAAQPPGPLAAKAVRVWHGRARGFGAGDKIPRALLTAAREARKRARRRGWSFGLTLDQLLVLWRRAAGRCEVSGLPFNSEPTEHRWNPFGISLDRINCGLGYDYENVRLVCVCVNAALNQWGDTVFWKMVLTAAEQIEKGDGYPVRPPSAKMGGR